ncbi:unnamed protein product, partial [Sphacelaria rigidula]
DRAARVRYHGAGPLLGVQGAGKTMEVFMIRNEALSKKKMKRRLKRAKEKAQQKLNASKEALATDEGTDRLVAGDELESAVVLRADHRVRSFDFSPTMSGGGKGGGNVDAGTGVGSRVLVALHNNSSKNTPSSACSCSRLAILDMQGHRSDVRAVAISSDGSMVASVSHGLAKVWSSKSRQCVRSSPCGFGLAVVFAPGDRHLLIGTKEGNLQV